MNKLSLTEKKEIQRKINVLLVSRDWFDLVQLIKNDPTDYALYYLTQTAIKQLDTLERLQDLITEGLK